MGLEKVNDTVRYELNSVEKWLANTQEKTLIGVPTAVFSIFYHSVWNIGCTAVAAKLYGGKKIHDETSQEAHLSKEIDKSVKKSHYYGACHLKGQTEIGHAFRRLPLIGRLFASSTKEKSHIKQDSIKVQKHLEEKVDETESLQKRIKELEEKNKQLMDENRRTLDDNKKLSEGGISFKTETNKIIDDLNKRIKTLETENEAVKSEKENKKYLLNNEVLKKHNRILKEQVEFLQKTLKNEKKQFSLELGELEKGQRLVNNARGKQFLSEFVKYLKKGSNKKSQDEKEFIKKMISFVNQGLIKNSIMTEKMEIDKDFHATFVQEEETQEEDLHEKILKLTRENDHLNKEKENLLGQIDILTMNEHELVEKQHENGKKFFSKLIHYLCKDKIEIHKDHKNSDVISKVLSFVNNALLDTSILLEKFTIEDEDVNIEIKDSPKVHNNNLLAKIFNKN